MNRAPVVVAIVLAVVKAIIQAGE